MNTINCKDCGEVIHPMRLEILPYTRVCVKCSQEGRKVGKIVSYGTGEEIGTTLEILHKDKVSTTTMVEDLEINEEGLELLKSTDDDTGEDTYISYSYLTKLPEED